MAWPHFGLHVDFDPELFLVLFIPPLLLFAEAGKRRRASSCITGDVKFSAWRLVLVLITVVGVGYLIYATMKAGIPLVAAFALAAVPSSRPMPVALSGIVGKGRIPKPIMGVLEGEALMNDASGLVSLSSHIAWR